jgi:hypothetical protein
VTSCSHCQEASREFEKLQSDFGGRGFHAALAAFDQGADVAGYARRFGLTIPMGGASADQMRAFLGISPGRRVATPQVVLIGRTGKIRAQSAPEGTPMLRSPEVLRALIEALPGRHSVL